MKFKKVRGVYYGIANNGQIVRFYDKAEMLACARERIEILKLVGNKSEAQACADSLGQCIRRGSVFKMNGMRVILRPKKKIVRITIDPDVEYVGTRINTSSVSQASNLPLEGKAIKKALA